ncbi:tetratricopeptide repeat protein [Candidatus Peribacteria bacterium]|nr:tetratricopeptide repeat protein [Candidatus Peribacteria bacterium]
MAMRSYPDAIYTLLEQAWEAKLEEEYEEAMALLQTIILEEPACLEAYEELADVYLHLRELDKAEKAITRALQLDPRSANAHYLRGFLYSLESNWEASVTELEQADKATPNHPEILRCLGWSLYNAQRRAQGISVLERSVEMFPENIDAASDLGVCYMNSGEFTKAEEVFERVLELDSDSPHARECLKFVRQMKKLLDGGEGADAS